MLLYTNLVQIKIFCRDDLELGIFGDLFTSSDVIEDIEVIFLVDLLYGKLWVVFVEILLHHVIIFHFMAHVYHWIHADFFLEMFLARSRILRTEASEIVFAAVKEGLLFERSFIRRTALAPIIVDSSGMITIFLILLRTF